MISGGDWLTTSKPDNWTISCSYKANSSTASRTGTIQVTTSDESIKPQDVTITQAGQSGPPVQPILSVSPYNNNVGKDDVSTAFSVANTGTGSMSWTAQVTYGGWLTITSGASGTNSGTITCSFGANTDTSPRTSTIRVTAPGATGSPQDVTVTQAGQSGPPPQPVLSVSPTTLTVGMYPNYSTSMAPNYARILVSNTGTGSLNWTAQVTSGGDWLQIRSGASGTNSGEVNVGFLINTSVAARTGVIRITANGASGSPVDISVSQVGHLPLTIRVPDTGQTLCYDVAGNVITCPSPGQALYGQDGNYSINPMFYTKLDAYLARSMGESRSSVIGRGLATMKANAGTLISYSTKEGEVAADGRGKHSPYTEALLKHIEMPGVEIGLLLRKVREDVIAATKNKQVPWEYGSLLGEFYFSGPVTIQVQPEVSKSATGSKNESLYWESIMNDTDPAAFEEYLKKYPDGEFSGLARYKINSLIKGGKKPPPVDVIPQSEQIKPSGSLNISSDPSDALVVLDGNPIGYTDMEISGVDVGNRKIEMKKDCFETKTIEVFINSNQQLKLNLKLKPSCGAISVTSNPVGADIFMNEKLVGVTPAELTELKLGTYTISLKKEGYEEWKDTAIVRAVKTVLIKADLKAVVVAKPPAQQPTIEIVPPVVAKPPSQQPTIEIVPLVAEHKVPELHFTVEATPPDSRINILNIQGKYQKGMVLKPGKYQVEVLRDGYETSTQWITMDQSDVVLPVVLTPLQKENLRVTAEPLGADVNIDKKPADSVPVEPSGVSTGNQQATVKKPNHDETVQAGKTTSAATASLKPPSRYTKLDINGKQSPSSAQSWMMVLDNETSLIWEVKQNKDGINNYDNPNDADNKYLSYESDKKFIKVLNVANWGGFSDWRVPSKEELDTLVDSKGTKRTINTAYFPNTQSSSYWSSGGERVDFGSSPDYGYGSNRDVSDSKDHGGYVRAVRGGK